MRIQDRFIGQETICSCLIPELVSGKQKTISIPAEHHAEIRINGDAVFRIVCTPEYLPELTIGRLLSEAYIRSVGEIFSIDVCPQGVEIDVNLTHTLEMETSVQEVPSCCTENQTFRKKTACEEWKYKLQPVPYRNEWILQLLTDMQLGLPLYTATHGVHSALIGHEGKMLCFAEDIGRHNALDKVIGLTVLKGIPLSECILCTSGRTPVDMVRKVIQAGIPVLVSKSVPTMQAIELARDAGLTLVSQFPDKTCRILSGETGD